MPPPILKAAREILADATAKAHASGDLFAEVAAAAIDVVLAELDRRMPAATATTHGTEIPAEALASDLLACPFCGRADVLHVEAFPGSDCPIVRCRACLCIGPMPPPEGRDRRGATASWNRRKPAAGSEPSDRDATPLCDFACPHGGWCMLRRDHSRVDHAVQSCACGVAPTHRGEGAHGRIGVMSDSSAGIKAIYRASGGVEVRTREHAIALFGRGSAMANAPLPFVMVDGTAISEPAPGAPRVLCGNLVNRGGAGGGSCCLRYGHDEECKVVSGPPIDCPARITRPCAADCVRATLACWSDEEREAARAILSTTSNEAYDPEDSEERKVANAALIAPPGSLRR